MLVVLQCRAIFADDALLVVEKTQVELDPLCLGDQLETNRLNESTCGRGIQKGRLFAEIELPHPWESLR